MKTRLELEQEDAKIRAQLLAKDARLQAQDQRINSQDQLIDQLNGALILARHRQFSRQTESLRSLQSELVDEMEGLVEALSQKADTQACEEDLIDVPAH